MSWKGFNLFGSYSNSNGEWVPVSSDKEQVKRMADLLKSGAAMLFEHCPQCGSPLFKIRDEVWCPTCNKRVIIVKGEEEIPDFSSSTLLSDVEKIVLSKVQEVSQRIKDEEDISKLEKLGNLLSMWLEVLEKVRKNKRV